MLYDLNIAWSPSTSAADLERTLRFSSQLGYNVVALNHYLEAPLPSQITNPLPKFPTSQTSTTDTSSTQQRIPTVLHRATISFSDTAHNQHLPKVSAAYDIVAMRPQTDKAFLGACVSVQEASIISLDLTQRLPFYLRPKPCMAAVNRGLRFEICYGRAVGLEADARARANFAGNVVQLVRATRGRGLVLSSEASAALAMALRAPADVLNLLNVWGLPADRGREALGVNPRGVVVNEGIKRSGFRGVVDIVGVAERPEAEKQRIRERQEQQELQLQLQQQQKKNKQAKKGNKKRKNGEGEMVGGGEGGENQGMSKRQAKKTNAALRQKETDEKPGQS